MGKDYKIFKLNTDELTEQLKIDMANISKQCGTYVGMQYDNWCQVYSKCNAAVFLFVAIKPFVEEFAGYALAISSKAGIVEIYDVCFDPNHRGRGYAKILINYMISFIKAENQRSWLGVALTNPSFQPALRTYIKAGYYADIEITNTTLSGKTLGFEFVGLSLTDTDKEPSSEKVDEIVKYIYNLADKFYKKTNQILLTFVIKEKDVMGFKDYINYDREYGGSFTGYPTGYEREYFLTIDQSSVTTDPNTSDICAVHLGKSSFKPLNFHTHPLDCKNREDSILSIPSSADFANSKRK